jgi:hypothetical protein
MGALNRIFGFVILAIAVALGARGRNRPRRLRNSRPPIRPAALTPPP